jgi:hypothetical protein
LDEPVLFPLDFPLDAELDLKTGAVNLTWGPPTSPQTESFTLSLVGTDLAPAPSFFFGSDATSDAAAYAFTVVLL